MPQIRLEHVTKRWGKFYGVDDLSLTIKDNAFVTLLGPSGCGKTTTLRMIAGLETPTSGKITIGDTVVFDSESGINVPANKRKVGFLFQNYALWPNMTVYQNISFGLSNIKEEMDQYSAEAREADRLIGVLKNPDTALAAVEDARDKAGKPDEKKALIHLTETLLIPLSSARKLYRILASSSSYDSDIKALEDVIALGCDRLLTSGLASSAYEGRELIARLVSLAGDRIVIMPGAGIRPSNIAEIEKGTCAPEYHGSAHSKRGTTDRKVVSQLVNDGD